MINALQVTLVIKMVPDGREARFIRESIACLYSQAQTLGFEAEIIKEEIDIPPLPDPNQPGCCLDV